MVGLASTPSLGAFGALSPTRTGSAVGGADLWFDTQDESSCWKVIVRRTEDADALEVMAKRYSNVGLLILCSAQNSIKV